MVIFDGDCSVITVLDGDFSVGGFLDGDYGEFKIVSDIPVYEGGYEVTPGPTEQVLQTSGMQMEDNIRVAPIPQNYGLITWDGSVITVS